MFLSFLSYNLPGITWVFPRIPYIFHLGAYAHSHRPAEHFIPSVQFSHSVMSDLCNPMDCSMLGLPVYQQFLEFIQTHVHSVGDATQPSYPRSSPSPPTFNLSQHQSLFKWVSSSYQVYKAVVLSMVTLVFSVVSLVQKVLSRFAFFNLYYKSRRCRIFSSKH